MSSVMLQHTAGVRQSSHAVLCQGDCCWAMMLFQTTVNCNKVSQSAGFYLKACPVGAMKYKLGVIPLMLLDPCTSLQP